MNPRFRSEDGSALALALAFLSLFALLIGAVLGFSETGLRSSRAVAGQGDAIAAADGALKGAIERERPDGGEGLDGSDRTCFEPPALNAVVVTVRCEGQPGSGAVSGGGNDASAPAYAVLTLGQGSGGEHGFVKTVGGSTLGVTGRVFSRSTIDVAGDLVASGSVQAVGACTGSISGSPVRCSNVGGGGVNPADGADPGYPAAVSSAPAARAVPGCGSGWLVTFSPGTYSDVSGLNDLFKGTSCSGKVFWFQPGTYYFPFSGTWQVKDANANLVGGTPSGWSTSAPSRPTIGVPGGCDKAASGVQFIFGGAAQLDVQSGGFELCAEPHDDQQRIAIYGVGTAGGAPTTATLTAANASGSGFTPVNSARQIDGVPAVAAIPATNPGSSRSVTLTNFGGIPSGAQLTAATLRIAHQETPTNNIASITASVQPATGPSTNVSVGTRSSLGTDQLDLLAAGMSTTPDATGFTVTYTVTAKNNQNPVVGLDGIELVLTYTTTLTPSSGCVVQTPFPGPGACALLTISGQNTAAAIHGTVYTPLAAVSMQTPNASIAAFRRGVIARTVNAHVPTSWGGGSAAITVPSTGTTSADRLVLFTAIIEGVDRIRALVRFDDGGGSTPGQSVTIQEWSVL